MPVGTNKTKTRLAFSCQLSVLSCQIQLFSCQSSHQHFEKQDQICFQDRLQTNNKKGTLGTLNQVRRLVLSFSRLVLSCRVGLPKEEIARRRRAAYSAGQDASTEGVPVRKTPPFLTEPRLFENVQFAKTGSGQALRGKAFCFLQRFLTIGFGFLGKKRSFLCDYIYTYIHIYVYNISESNVFTWCYRCSRHIYINIYICMRDYEWIYIYTNHQFTKTGSGQR
eukprot:COSAG06_NODE_122_length_23062_cov_43.568990_13_plen_223_part_00